MDGRELLDSDGTAREAGAKMLLKLKARLSRLPVCIRRHNRRYGLELEDGEHFGRNY